MQRFFFFKHQFDTLPSVKLFYGYNGPVEVQPFYAYS